MITVMTWCVNAAPAKELDEIKVLPPAGMMAAAVDGGKLYVVSFDQLQIYDIADAKAPRLLGTLRGLGTPRQIAVQNQIAYITSRQHGLYLVDIGNPMQPKLLSHYDTIDMATGIDIAGGLAAVACRNHGVELLDIRDPAKIRHLATVRAGEAQSAIIRGNYLYTGAWHNRQVVITDITDPRQPVIIGRADLDGYGDGLDVRDNFLYAATGHHSAQNGHGQGHGMEIYDLTDLRHPKRTGIVKFPPFYSLNFDMWSVKTDGKYAFVNDSHNGLFVVDVSNKQAPQIVAKHTFGFNPDKKENNPIAGLAVGNQVLYCAGIWTGLHLIEATGFARPISPQPSPPVTIPDTAPAVALPDGFKAAAFDGPATAVATDGKTVWLGLGPSGIAVLQIDQAGNWRQTDRYPTQGFVADLKIRGDLIISAEDRAGVRFWRIGPDGELKHLSTYLPKKQIVRQIGVYSEFPYALLQEGSSTLVILDVRNPEQPLEIFRQDNRGFNYGHQFPNALIDGRYAGIFWHTSGVFWYDLAGTPVKTVKMSRLSWMNGAAVIDNQLLLLAGDKLLPVPPDFPDDLEKLPRFGAKDKRLTGRWLLTDGDMLYLMDHAQGKIQFVDISDRQHPVITREYEIPGNPGLPVRYRDRLLIPAGYQGLLSVKL